MGVYAAPGAGIGAANRTVRILVLDDDPVDAGLLADACSAVPEYDVRCRIAPDLRTARAVMELEPVDLVFADYWLGAETSIGFVAELAARPHGPAVVITSDAEALDVQTVGLRAGAVAFLPKADVSRTSVRVHVHAVAAGLVPPRPAREPCAASVDAVVAERLARRAERVAMSAVLLRHGSTGDADAIAGLRSLSDRIRADAREISRLLKDGGKAAPVSGRDGSTG